MNRVLLLGGSGILGSEVLRQLQLGKMDYSAPQSSNLDVRDKTVLENFVYGFKPQWIVNCVAWTNVDGAEEFFEAALDLNERAVRNIAEVARKTGCRVIHISTDYVFDGTSVEPYDENALVKPLNRYGESKLRGERALLNVIPTKAYVVRTSWLYGLQGKNFVKTMALKALREEPAKVVDDQVGNPTSARDLAEAVISIINKLPEPGIYNFSNNGKCSWFELAQQIYKEVGADEKLVEAVKSSSLKMKANRPKNSLLCKEKWELTAISEIPDWRISLKSLLPEIMREIDWEAQS